MSAPSDPEKYSIDEIMERLKRRPADESIDHGELVTRSDGTQAIRVHRKKRRSHQPIKEPSKSQLHFRILQISGLLIFLLLALFGAGSAIVFANSTLFRERLSNKIAATCGASVELQQFRMNPTSANASALTLTWPGDSALESLSLKGLKADISPISFLGKSMIGKEVSAAEGTLTLRASPSMSPPKEIPSPEENSVIRFGHYIIPKFHIMFGDPTAASIRLRDSEATFIPQNPTQRPQLLLTRGQVSITGWPKLRMDRSHIELSSLDANIVSMRLRHETDSLGIFQLSGIISPYTTNPTSTLAVQLQSFLLSGIVGTELSRLVSGRIDTLPSNSSNFLSLTPGQIPDSSLSISFGNALASTIDVTGFQFLPVLSQALNDKWFANPVFDSEIRGLLRRIDGSVTISDLNLESKDRMALRGTITVMPNGESSGELEVGIAEGMIKTSENQRLESVFTPSKEGFRWLTLKIGGNAKAPTDNFKVLYDSVVIEATPAPTRSIPTFEELTKPK
jgi:hypothetical protein